MSSRPGSGSGSTRQRPRESHGDRPSLPVPALPPLRTSIRPPPERDVPNPFPAPLGRPPARTWSSTASRRAERIRNLEDRPPSFDDLDYGLEPSSWLASSRRNFRFRALDRRRPNMEDLDQTLDDANSQLRSLLDMTDHINLMTPLSRSTFSRVLRPDDSVDDNRRSKRQKIDSHRLAPTLNGFRYGKYGQVEPGQLRMEIVSCDGGMFSNESSYAAENILKNDSSVYCTKGNRCNIVLRHQGATVFTLRELVIKAPGPMNYSHPVREGMVFVSMSQDGILSRTAQYQIQYSPVTRDRSWLGQGGDRPAHDRDARHIISIRHHDDGTTTTRARRSYVYRIEDDECDYRMPQMPPEFVGEQPNFRVTTECSDDEEDDCEAPQAPRRPPNRIGSLPFEARDSSSDSDDGGPPLGSDVPPVVHEARARQYQRRHGHRRHFSSPRLADGLGLTLADGWDAQAAATAGTGGQLLSPHARFFIEKKKSKCTIRFEPPVSGRFILLKIWSSHHDPASNIDIQSVIARGFAGPRYFPSLELR